MLLLVLMLVVALGSTGCQPKKAEEAPKYPTGPITVISPWPAGGASGTALRGYMNYAEKYIGHSINVIDVLGGNGAIAWTQAKASKNDGYTLVMLTFDILTEEAKGAAAVSYKDFELLGQFTAQGTVFITHKDSGWNTLADFVAAAKARPGQLNIGTAGEGGVWHQAGALMAEALGIEVNFVPFTGSSDQLAAMLGKHIDGMVSTVSASIPSIQEGTLRLLGVMSESRIPLFPNSPTFKELGYNVVYESWRGMAAPKGTPQHVLDFLRKAFKQTYDDKEFQAWATERKMDQAYLDHEAFKAKLDQMYPNVLSVMKKLGLTVK